MVYPVVEERFEYKGYPCVVLFQSIGFRTAYVGLKKDNRYYGKDYEDIYVSCHGGLTYSASSLYGQSDEEVWWIGFDAGHIGDGYDIEHMRKYYPEEKDLLLAVTRIASHVHGIIRTFDYMKEQCMSIVDRLKGEMKMDEKTTKELVEEQELKEAKTNFDCFAEDAWYMFQSFVKAGFDEEFSKKLVLEIVSNGTKPKTKLFG